MFIIPYFLMYQLLQSTVKKYYSHLQISEWVPREGTLIFRGCIHSLSKFENTPKALISAQKKHPYFQKTLTFSSLKTPLLLSKHWHWMNGNTYLNFRLYNSLPGGGGTEVQRGAAPSLGISRKKGPFFKTSACPRFCKRRVLFCTQVRSMGVKIPLQSTKYTRLWRRVTPEVTQGFRVCCRHLLPLNKQRIIKS